ncbi:hypothetical protein J7E24_10965 [Hymenobacter sp. ISL-91]|uniref:DUF6044 family protein n=1 Tax=Hymenobacter sp. ISL-91 TaxID=2819151 RepID=UPI001BEB06F9|nr:DUF6044 family protein [Hymenobacter sp. ISL-91]MBT2558306.1 hypothetical protein [Hymenobacter sp. ISL-91]
MPAPFSAIALPFRPRRVLLGAALALLLLALVYVAPAGRTYILLDDNLDTELATGYALVAEGKALDYRPGTVVERLLNGLPRNALRPGLQPLVGLQALLPTLPAYLLHELLVRLAGLVSMYWLLRRHLLPGPRNVALCAGLALAWAVLPAYTTYGVSVLGQPAVAAVLLQLRRQPARWPNYVVLGMFGLWSSLVLAGVFVLLAGGVLLLWEAWRGRYQAAGRLLLGLAVLAATYLVVEYPLVSALLGGQFVSHRLEFDYARLALTGAGVGLLTAARYFLLGHYHSGQLVWLAPLLAAGGAAFLVPAGAARNQLRRVLVVWVGALAGAALFCGFYPQLTAVGQQILPLLRAFNLSRLHFLLPLAWFCLLVFSLRHLPAGRGRWALVALQLLLGLGFNTEWTLNVRRLLGRLPASEPTYAAYVAPGLFGKVQQAIVERTGQPPAAYRVACLGFPPAVATLNGFFTLDAYLNNYPLAYKHAFRPLIAGELAKSPALATYFDAWGNRCYLFSAELGKNFRVPATPARTVQHWQFDAAAFRRLGGRYVFSAARLARPGASGLRLFGQYASPNAYWHLWVYEVL